MLSRWLRPTSTLLGILVLLQPSSAFLMKLAEPDWSEDELENSPWSVTRVRRIDDEFPSNEHLQMESMYPSHLPLIVAALDAVKGRSRRFSGSSSSSQVGRTYSHGHRKTFSSWRGKRSYNGVTLDSPFSLLWRRKRRAVSSPLKIDDVKNRNVTEDDSSERGHAGEASAIDIPPLLFKPRELLTLTDKKLGLPGSSDKVSHGKQHELKQLNSKTVNENHTLYKRSIIIDDILGSGDQGLLQGQAVDKDSQQPAFENVGKTPNPLAEKHLPKSAVPEADSEDVAFPRLIMKPASQFNDGKMAPMSSKDETTQASRETVGVRPHHAERTPKQTVGVKMTTSTAGTTSPWTGRERRPIVDVRDMSHGQEANRSTSRRNKDAVRHGQWHQPLSVNRLSVHQKTVTPSSADQAEHDDFHTHFTDSSQPGVGPFYWVESVESIADPADTFHQQTQGTKAARPTISSTLGDRTDPTIFDINADRRLLTTLTSRAIIDTESAPHPRNTVHASRDTQYHSGQKMSLIHNSHHPLPKMSEELRLVPFHPAELSRQRPMSSKTVVEKSDTNSSGFPEHWLPVFRKQQPMLRRQRLPLLVTNPPQRINGLQEPSSPMSAVGHPTEHAVQILAHDTIQNTAQRSAQGLPTQLSAQDLPTQHSMQGQHTQRSTQGVPVQRSAQGLPQQLRGKAMPPISPPSSLPPQMNLNAYLNRTLTSELSPIRQMGLGALPFFGDSGQDIGPFPSLGGAGLMGTHADVQEDTPFGKRQIKYREFAVLSTQGGITLSANDKGYLTVKVAMVNDDNGRNKTVIVGNKETEHIQLKNFSENGASNTLREFNFQSGNDGHVNIRDGVEDSAAFGSEQSSELQSGTKGHFRVRKYNIGNLDNKDTFSVQPTRMVAEEGFLSDTLLKRRQQRQAGMLKHHRQDLLPSSTSNGHSQGRSPISAKPKDVKTHIRIKRSLQSPEISAKSSHEQPIEREQIKHSSVKESNINASRHNSHSVEIHDSRESSPKDLQQKKIPNKNQDKDILVKQSIRSYKTFKTRVPKPSAQQKARYPSPISQSSSRRYSNKVFPRSLLFKPIHSALSNPYLKFRNNNYLHRSNFRIKPFTRPFQPAAGRQYPAKANSPAADSNGTDNSTTDENRNETGTPLNSRNDTVPNSDRIKELLKLFNIKFKIFLQPFSGNRLHKNHTDMVRERRDRWWNNDQGYTSYFPFPLGNMGWVTFLQYNHVHKDPKPKVSYAKL